MRLLLLYCVPAKMAATSARLLRYIQNNVGVLRFVQRQNGSTKRYIYSLMAAATGGGVFYAYNRWMRNKQLQILPVVHARNQEEVGSVLFAHYCLCSEAFLNTLYPSHGCSIICPITYSNQKLHAEERKDFQCVLYQRITQPKGNVDTWSKGHNRV